VLLQNANDLLFAETASLHRLSPQLENRLTSKRRLFRGAGQLRSYPIHGSTITSNAFEIVKSGHRGFA
ncbi:hypothetical protein LCL97_24000, partial [Seohaeicola saemankumensis]